MVNGYIISQLISLHDEHTHLSLSRPLPPLTHSWCCYRKEIAQRTRAGKSTVLRSLLKHTPWHRILKNQPVAQPIRNSQLRPKYNISWNSIQIFWYLGTLESSHCLAPSRSAAILSYRGFCQFLQANSRIVP